MPRPENIPGGLRDEARRAGEMLFESYPGYQLSQEDIPRLPGLGANYSYTATVGTGQTDNEGREIVRSVIVTSRDLLSLSQIRDRAIDAFLAASLAAREHYQSLFETALVREDMRLVDVDAIYRK